MTSYLDKLRKLSRNLWWTWHPEVIAIYRDLNPARWRGTHHNPLAFLEHFEEWELLPRAEEMAIDSRINYAFHRLQEYLAAPRPGRHRRPRRPARPARGLLLAPSSACTSPCPSTRAAWGSWPATTSRAPRDLGMPLVGVGLSTARATSASTWTPRAGSRRPTARRDLDTLPMAPRPGPGRQAPDDRRRDPRPASIHARRLAGGGGPLHPAPARLATWTPTTSSTASSRARSTAATGARASARSCCWASAACARWRAWASSPACCT